MSLADTPKHPVLFSAIEHIQATAECVATQAYNIVQERSIDPKQVIFVTGELHNQMSHTIFEMALTQKNKEFYGGCRMLAELQPHVFNDLDLNSIRDRVDHWPNALRYMIEGTTYNYHAAILPAFAAGYGHDFYKIDAPRDTVTIELDNLPESIIKRCDTIPYYGAIRTDYPGILYPANYFLFEKTSHVARDLIMTQNANDVIGACNKDIPSHLMTGVYHAIAKPFDKNRSLTSHLIEDGFFVVPVILGSDDDTDTAEIFGLWQELKHNLSNDQKTKIIADYCINMPGSDLANAGADTQSISRSLQHHLKIQH